MDPLWDWSRTIPLGPTSTWPLAPVHITKAYPTNELLTIVDPLDISYQIWPSP